MGLTPVAHGTLIASRFVLVAGLLAWADAAPLAQTRPPELAQTRPQPPRPQTARRTPVGPRGFLAIDGLHQMTSRDEQEQRALSRYGETGSLSVATSTPRAAGFGASGGWMLTRQLGVGVGVTRVSPDVTAEVAASIPHPFFFGRPRQVAGTVPSLTHAERAFDVHARGVFPVSRVQVAVFGGPSWISVQRDVVASIRVAESYPYDAVTLTGTDIERVEGTALGIHAGVDVAYYLDRGRKVGVGGTVHLSKAETEFTTSDGTSHVVHLGGARIGGGLRVRF